MEACRYTIRRPQAVIPCKCEGSLLSRPAGEPRSRTPAHAARRYSCPAVIRLAATSAAPHKRALSTMNIHPSKEAFIGLAAQGNVIPVFADLMADFETPVSAYAKLKEAGPSYLLES